MRESDSLAHHQSEWSYSKHTTRVSNGSDGQQPTLSDLACWSRRCPRSPKSFQRRWTHQTDLFPNSSESPQTLQTANSWPGVFQALPQLFSFSVHWGSRRSWARNLSTFSKRQHRSNTCQLCQNYPGIVLGTLALLHVFSTFRRLVVLEAPLPGSFHFIVSFLPKQTTSDLFVWGLWHRTGTCPVTLQSVMLCRVSVSVNTSTGDLCQL